MDLSSFKVSWWAPKGARVLKQCVMIRGVFRGVCFELDYRCWGSEEWRP